MALSPLYSLAAAVSVFPPRRCAIPLPWQRSPLELLEGDLLVVVCIILAQQLPNIALASRQAQLSQGGLQDRQHIWGGDVVVMDLLLAQGGPSPHTSISWTSSFPFLS